MLKKAAGLRKAEAEVKAERGSNSLYLNLSLNLNLLPAGGPDPGRMQTLTKSLLKQEEAMNVYRFNGKWMQFKGNLKQQWGKFINDDLQQIEGCLDKIIGQLQERDGGTCVSVVEEHYGEKKNELIKSAQSIANAVGAEAVGRIVPVMDAIHDSCRASRKTRYLFRL
jgi:uncharacterized protein YjbJ (UPF0337 family)